ncbi:MAG: hypothetical protein P1U86_22315 [Verrucomicrobiales bacterium]|nr:hypothetical protein [Verrucomicrobiales bacterium]
MKPHSKVTLALALSLFLLSGLEKSGAAEGSELLSRHQVTAQIPATDADHSSTDAHPDRLTGFSEVTQSDRKRLLAGIGYLYAGFLIALFFCEMSIRREKQPEPTLYLVKK